MTTKLLRRSIFASVFFLGLGTNLASAATIDERASQKIDQAINVHYLETNFDKAEGVLLGIVKACEGQCGGSTIARSWMYVGIVRGAGRSNYSGAKQAFIEAFKHDPNVQLDRDLVTPEVEKAWNDAKGHAPVVAAPVVEEVDLSGPPEAVLPPLACSWTATETQSRRPLPMVCTSDNEDISKLSIRYREFGTTVWKSVEMTAKDKEYQGTIPCDATLLEGTLRFYVEASDDSEAISRFGSQSAPKEIAVLDASTAAPAKFPGLAAPPRCGTDGKPEEAASMMSNGGSRPWGAVCEIDNECEGGLVCLNEICEMATMCSDDSACDSGLSCIDEMCRVDRRPPTEEQIAESKIHRHNFTLGFGIDFITMPREYTACDADSPYNCQSYVPNAYGKSTMKNGAMHVNIGYEYLLSAQFALEGQFGMSFLGGSSGLLPFTAMARAKYYFGDLENSLFVPYGAVQLGYGETQATRNVYQYDANGVAVSGTKAYYQAGQIFGGLSIGTLIGKGQHHAIIDLGFNLFFPATSFAITPTAGYRFSL